MANSPKKRRSTRSKSTTSAVGSRPKRVRKKEKEVAPQEAPQPAVEGSQAQPEPQPALEAAPPVEMDVFPQPGMNTHLLPEDAPSIVTGYVRLITLGVSFFLAVYLGLEAFSIFVAFPEINRKEE